MKKNLLTSFFVLSSFFFCSAQFDTLKSFNGANGKNPWGDLTLANGRLYGMTEIGGAHNYGCIFSIDTNGNRYKDMLDFNGTNGKNPYGSLLYVAGKLYGMASGGGANTDGVVFSIDTNGSNYRDLFDFNQTNGLNPRGSLIRSGDTLYGMTYSGGPSTLGNIFYIDTDGSGFHDIFDFNFATNAYYPYGSLTLSGNVLYGMTYSGSGNDGTVFSIHTDGTSFTHLVTFNNGNGSYPHGNLLLIGKELFGMAYKGATGYGTIFSVDTNGNSFKNLFDFVSFYGEYPYGSLTLAAGKLFGMTSYGGAYAYYGNIFSVDTDGTHFSDLYDFNSPGALGPLGSLTLSSGQEFYAMATYGGPSTDGVIFKYNNTLHETVKQIGVTCAGGNATVTAVAGTPPYTYLWSDINSQTTDTATGLSAGTYTITVTDNAATSSTASVIITMPAPLWDSIFDLQNVRCYGDNTGGASIMVSGGTGPYTYLWYTHYFNQATPYVGGLVADTYEVRVTDHCGDSIESYYTITQPSEIIYTTDSAAAMGSNHGIASVSVSGGIPPYTYLWTPGNQTTDSAKNLTAGNYCCTITDHNGCTQSACTGVPECYNTYVEPICVITFDTATVDTMAVNSYPTIIWGRTHSPPPGSYGFYNLYQYYMTVDSVITVGNFTRVVWDTFLVPGQMINQQPFDSLSEYRFLSPMSILSDTVINNAIVVNGYAGPIFVAYALSTTDSCEESPLSPVVAPMYLVMANIRNGYLLNWTGYTGITPTEYRIFRGASMNSMVQIDSVANSVFYYFDTLSPPANPYYLIEAVCTPPVCTPTRSPRVNNAPSGLYSNMMNTAMLGIKNTEDAINKLTVYPNPSNGMVTMSYSMNRSASIQISVIDELGRIVYTENKNKNIGAYKEQLNLQNLATGIYSLRMQTSTDVTSQKLVLIRNK